MTNVDLNAIAAVTHGTVDPVTIENEARIRAAQLRGDVDALESLLDDDLLFTGPDGRLATKAEDLEAHRSRAVQFRSHEPEELRIRRVNADVVISALRARLEVAIGEQIVRGSFRYTRIWQRDAQGSWRVVGGHVSEVHDPSSRPGTP